MVCKIYLYSKVGHALQPTKHIGMFYQVASLVLEDELWEDSVSEGCETGYKVEGQIFVSCRQH